MSFSVSLGSFSHEGYTSLKYIIVNSLKYLNKEYRIICYFICHYVQKSEAPSKVYL